MAQKLSTLREITQDECPWLDAAIPVGTTVYRYFNTTYGCIGPSGIAVSFEHDRTPFFEVPLSAIYETIAAKQLDDKGRCCGRKPIEYKRPRHKLFCDRCDATYDPATGKQGESWAYRANEDGTFTKTFKPKDAE